MSRSRGVEVHLDAAAVSGSKTTARMLLETGEEFQTAIEHNRSFMPYYGGRYRRDQRISTSFVESTLNQEAKAVLEELSCSCPFLLPLLKERIM
jgi:hypothetical protein